MTRLKGKDDIQREFDRFERWMHVNLRQINKAKCKGQPQTKVQAVQEWIESNLEKKDTGLLVDEKLNMIQQCKLPAQKVKLIMGCIKKSMHGKTCWWKWFPPSTLLSWGPGLLLPALGYQHEKALDLLEGVLRRTTKMTTRASLTKAPRILQESFASSWPDATFCHSFAADYSQKVHIGLMDLWSDLIEYYLMLQFQMCGCVYMPICTLGNSLLFAWCHGRHSLLHHQHPLIPRNTCHSWNSKMETFFHIGTELAPIPYYLIYISDCKIGQQGAIFIRNK